MKARGKGGEIPPELRPIIENLGRRAVAMGQQKLAGLRASREVFRSDQAVA